VSAAADRRTALRERLDAAYGAMHRAASAAAIKGDPLGQQMEALAETLRALGEIYEASADTQLEIANKLRTQAGAVADEAIARVHASGVGIIEQLAPRLTTVVEQAARANQKALRLRVIVGGGAALVIGLGLVGGVSFASGFSAGRSRGELAGHTIAAAMAAGPEAAAAWSSLMANNEPVQALAACNKAVTADSHGRRYCSMPVWLDPPPAPSP
jgi:hypothetical protein